MRSEGEQESEEAMEILGLFQTLHSLWSPRLMARGKGTPKRNQIDPDFSPTSPVPPSPSPSTPRRNPSSSTSSPRAAISLSQAQAPDKPVRGPLPASAETTYHQRLRGILVDCKKLRRQWNELVIRGLVGRVRAAIELWVDVE